MSVTQIKKAVKDGVTAAKINSLKREARELYLRIVQKGDSMSCGHALAQHVSSDYSTNCRELDRVLDQLAELDPSTPTTRFSK